MSPSFNAAERQRITAQLRATAADLFTTRGVRKTSLEELVAPAGISKSSFYSFFASKETLFIDLMLEQIAEIRPRLVATTESAGDARDGIAALLREIIATLDDNPLYRRLVTHPAELQAVRDRIGEEELDRGQRELVQPLVDFIGQAQRAGEVVDADPAVVFGVFQAVALVHVNSGEFDPASYQSILDLLIDTVAAGLTTR